MAQVTIYLPDELADRLRRQAKKAGRSLSAYVAELAAGTPTRSKWPAGFGTLYGSWQGDFPEVEDLPVGEPDPLA